MIASNIAEHVQGAASRRIRQPGLGFAPPNSDYNARFVYAHKQGGYLSVSLEEQRDVIDYPILGDLDVNGRDVRKALRLF